MPLTFRLIYHGFRAGVRALLLFVCAWLLLIPANEKEIVALGAAPGTSYPAGLRTMRTAQIVVFVAPPQVYSLIADVAGRGMPAFAVEMAFNQMAAGRVVPPSAQAAPEEPFSAREIEGPRFIRVD